MSQQSEKKNKHRSPHVRGNVGQRCDEFLGQIPKPDPWHSKWGTLFSDVFRHLLGFWELGLVFKSSTKTIGSPWSWMMHVFFVFLGYTPWMHFMDLRDFFFGHGIKSQHRMDTGVFGWGCHEEAFLQSERSAFIQVPISKTFRCARHWQIAKSFLIRKSWMSLRSIDDNRYKLVPNRTWQHGCCVLRNASSDDMMSRSASELGGWWTRGQMKPHVNHMAIQAMHGYTRMPPIFEHQDFQNIRIYIYI